MDRKRVTPVLQEAIVMTPFVMAMMLRGLKPDAVPTCFSSDVKQLCCPAACATKNSPKSPQANDVLRSCMRGIGCTDGESKNAIVGMRCEYQSR